MAITESSPTQPASGEPPAAGPPRSRARSPWRRWTPVTLATLVTAALVVLAVLAWTYQPIPYFSGESGGSIPGLPSGTGLRVVNTFGIQAGQLYVPPQRGAFTVVESFENTGPEAVTIEAVSILSPQDQAMIQAGAQPWPLIPAGQVLGWIETWRSPLPAARPIAGLALGPGQVMRIGIPVRLSNACYIKGSWSGDVSFYVKERFLIFTHWVAVPFGTPLLFQQPSEPQVPAKDVACPSG
jgi:hypothetical protein